MKKICVDARMYHSSGIGTYIRNMLPFLQKKYFLYILADIPQLPHSFSDKNCTKIPFKAPIYSVQEQWQFRRKIPLCDLFLSFHFNVPYFPIKAGKKMVVIHDVYHLAFYASLRMREKIYAKMLYKKAVRASEKVVTDSLFSYKEIQKYLEVPSKKLAVIPCAVNQELFKKKNIDICEKVLKKYKIQKPYFLFVGNFKRHKNIANIYAAFSQLSIKADLVLIGKKKGLLHSENIVKNHNAQKDFSQKIHVLESIVDEELIVFYQLAAALVFISLYEGFGLPILEAMSLGCPVIGSGRASVPEVGGNAIFYCNPLDPKDIAKKMEAIALNKDLQKYYREEGKKRSAQFSWEKSATMLLDTIDETIR